MLDHLQYYIQLALEEIKLRVSGLIRCRITSLPIVLKGILTTEDARLAVENEIDGIIVSNHGARQIDSVPATVGPLNSCLRRMIKVDEGISMNRGAQLSNIL